VHTTILRFIVIQKKNNLKSLAINSSNNLKSSCIFWNNFRVLHEVVLMLLPSLFPLRVGNVGGITGFKKLKITNIRALSNSRTSSTLRIEACGHNEPPGISSFSSYTMFISLIFFGEEKICSLHYAIYSKLLLPNSSLFQNILLNITHGITWVKNFPLTSEIKFHKHSIYRNIYIFVYSNIYFFRLRMRVQKALNSVVAKRYLLSVNSELISSWIKFGCATVILKIFNFCLMQTHWPNS
jgi:hypothetical protein